MMHIKDSRVNEQGEVIRSYQVSAGIKQEVEGLRGEYIIIKG